MMPLPYRFPIVALVLVLGGPSVRGADGPSSAAPKLESVTWGSVERAHRADGMYLASQPSKEDLELAKEAGVRTVVNLRKPAEIDWDEKGVVEKLGMEYDNPGFKEPEELTDGVLDGVRKILASAARPIFLHCASANRVGAVWLAHRVLDEAVPYPDALAEAQEVGLKSPAFRDRVKAYIDARRPR